MPDAITTGTTGSSTFGDQFSKQMFRLLQGAAGDERYAGRLENLTPLEYYPGQTYVDQDPYTLAAMQARADRAGAGTLSGTAEEYTSGVLSGDWLGSNPYVDAMYERAAGGVSEDYLRTVLPALETRFGRSGGRGGAYMGQRSAAMETLGDTLSGLATDIYGRAYDTERGLMDSSARMAPLIQQMGYEDINQLASTGEQREEYERIKLQDLMDRFYFQQDEPFLRVGRIASGASSLPMASGTGTTRTTQQSDAEDPDQMRMWERMLISLI